MDKDGDGAIDLDEFCDAGIAENKVSAPRVLPHLMAVFAGSPGSRNRTTTLQLAVTTAQQ